MDYEAFVDGSLIRAIYLGARWALRIWIPSSAFIVLGRFSRENEEVSENAKLPIKRRLGGGCSVVLYPGTIVTSIALKRSLKPDIFPRDWISLFNRTAISALQKLNLKDIHEQGWGDIVHKDRKVGGVSLYSSKDIILYQLSLIYDLNIDLISTNLKHPPREPDYRKGRSHSDFLISIREISPDVSVQDLMFSLEKEFKDTLVFFK